jgi:hypothetical protein
MNRLLEMSSRVYAAALPLLPPDLHRDFGSEIVAVFEEDLQDAWHRRGAAGAMRVWLCSGWEIVRIALPGLAARPEIAVPFVSFVLSAVIMTGEMMLALSHQPARDARGLILFMCGAALLQSFTVALTSYAVVRTGRLDHLGLCLK